MKLDQTDGFKIYYKNYFLIIRISSYYYYYCFYFYYYYYFHILLILIIKTSTAVEQVVACAVVTQRARVRSPVGTGFLGEVFFGVFPHLSDKCQETLGSQGPEYHLAVVFIIPYSPCWDDWVYAWCVLSFMFVLSRRWPRHSADHSSGEVSMSLCGQKSMYVIHSFIPSPDRSWLCKVRAAWVTS